MNSIDIKTAKPGIYYRVFFDTIEKNSSITNRRILK